MRRAVVTGVLGAIENFLKNLLFAVLAIMGISVIASILH
jgi:hypothetical protein